MRINEFKLERYFEKYDSVTKYVMCASDCESFEVKELLTSEGLVGLKELRLEYSQAQGDPFLRTEISQSYENIRPDQVVVCVPQEAIFLVMNALLNPGDQVVVQVPCYQSLCELPKALGCRVKAWEPKIENGKWQWDLSFLKRNVDKSTRLIVLNSPHNPTGSLFTKAEFEEAIEFGRANDCYVFSDEMYRYLEFDTKDRLPTGVDVYEKCVSLSGMSKVYGLGGLRIGWLCSRDEGLLHKVKVFKDYTTISNSALSEFVALAALKKKEEIVERNLGFIRKNLQLLDAFFDRHKDQFQWIRPHAGSIAFVRTKFKTDIEAFCENLVNTKGVLLMPGTKFGYGNEFFRIGFGRKDLPEALRLFEAYVEENLWTETNSLL